MSICVHVWLIILSVAYPCGKRYTANCKLGEVQIIVMGATFCDSTRVLHLPEIHFIQILDKNTLNQNAL